MTLQEFDPVFDCQKAFRALLDAMARPGSIQSMREPARKLHHPHAALMVAGMTLLDNRCGFSAQNAPALAEDLQQLTFARPVPAAEADYLFAGRTTGAEDGTELLLQSAKAGTLPEPHRSATLFIELGSLEEGEPLTLAGPGIDGQRDIRLSAEAVRWLRARQQAAWEYPCGAEIYFVTTQGDVLCIPRTTRVEGI